jgi:hypothetical protein
MIAHALSCIELSRKGRAVMSWLLKLASFLFYAVFVAAVFIICWYLLITFSNELRRFRFLRKKHGDSLRKTTRRADAGKSDAA